MNRLRTILEMIKFEHSVFALPFALTGALLAARFTTHGWQLETIALDHRRDGRRAQRRHDRQPHRRRSLRQSQSRTRSARWPLARFPQASHGFSPSPPS